MHEHAVRHDQDRQVDRLIRSNDGEEAVLPARRPEPLRNTARTRVHEPVEGTRGDGEPEAAPAGEQAVHGRVERQGANVARLVQRHPPRLAEEIRHEVQPHDDKDDAEAHKRPLETIGAASRSATFRWAGTAPGTSPAKPLCGLAELVEAAM